MNTKYLPYLCGYFLADGYAPESKTGQSLVYADTNDLSFAYKLASMTFGHCKHRLRNTITGTVCDIWTVTFGKEYSSLIRSCMQKYKDFNDYFDSLSSVEKDEFIQGLFDGDGSVCYYSNSKRVRMILFSADPDVSCIINKWSVIKGIKFSVSVDSRGHDIIQYSTGNRKDLTKIYLAFNYNLFPRKFSLIQKSMLQYDWFQVDNSWYTCDRNKIYEVTSLTPGNVYFILKSNKSVKGHFVKRVDFKDVIKSKIWI